MNRSDWVFVGVRLTGLFLLVQAALTLTGLLQLLDFHAEVEFVESSSLWMSTLGSLLVHALLGAGLFLSAPNIERWLAAKDARSGRSA